MDLNIDVIEKQDESIVYLSGEIDLYTAPDIKETVLPLTKKQAYCIQVDLDGVHYMDSTGLGVFISLLKSSKEHDSHLKIVNVQEQVFRLFEITGLNSIIDVHSKPRSEVK